MPVTLDGKTVIAPDGRHFTASEIFSGAAYTLVPCKNLNLIVAHKRSTTEDPLNLGRDKKFRPMDDPS